MNSKNARHEICCFAATSLCVGTFMLVLFALDYAAGDPASPLRLPLVIAAAVAFVLMILFVAIAIETESDVVLAQRGEATRRQRRMTLRHRATQASAPRPGM